MFLIIALLAAVTTGSSGPLPRSAGCPAGQALVLHAIYENYDDVTIAVDAREIVEAYSSHGVDYGMVVGANAEEAWRIDENGASFTDVGDAKRDLMTLRAVLCSDAYQGTTSSSLEAESPIGGWPVAVEKGPDTEGIARIEYSENGTRQVLEIYRDEALSDGTRVPTAWNVDGGRTVYVTRERRVQGDAISAVPKWEPTKQVVKTGSVPVHMTLGAFALDGNISGVPVSCIIDTGANNFAISSDLADLIDSRDSSLAQSHLIGQVVTARVGRVRFIDIAGTRFLTPVVYVDDRLPRHTALCGADYLANMLLELDITHLSASVSSRAGYSCGSGCVPIGSAGVATGNATIGGKMFHVLFDSGYAGSVRMPPEDLVSIRHAAPSRTTAYCVFPVVDTSLSIADAVSTGSVCPINVDRQIPIAIGAKAFANYRRVVIDYPDHLLQFVI